MHRNDGGFYFMWAIAVATMTILVLMMFVTIPEQFDQNMRVQCLEKYTTEQCKWALAEGERK